MIPMDPVNTTASLAPRLIQDDRRMLLRIGLVVGLLLRIIILSQTSALGTNIVDEQHYARLGANILAGNGYAMDVGQPTSIRPPLYPALLAATWFFTGSGNLQAVRVVQIGLSLLTTWVVFLIGRRVHSEAAGRMAALICWLYPSLIFSDYLILTETLFTLLLLAFVLLAIMLVQEPRARTAVTCGAVLALAALSRSVLWPAPLILCPLLLVLLREPLRRRVAFAALVFVAFAVVLAPWSIRNTRLQGVFTTVDTMGGINLRMGNYEHTPEDRMWDAVSVKGEQNWVYDLRYEHIDGPVTEGVKDKWAQRKAIQYMVANPGTTVRRSLIKFADFWGLEREFMAGVRDGFFNPPTWFAALASVAIVVAYALLALGGAAGSWLAAPRDWRVHMLLLFPVVLITGAHTIVFGHSRYHLPLMPILGVYAAMLVVAMPVRVRTAPRVLLAGASACVLLLAAIWVRQVVFVDAGRITTLLKTIGL
ncbi:MAG: glycosyltransferase family 39 protein [Acidobacteria bacterium]|nr:glycosyltransferase family 39 protein [Acidobacteriota bacterium]